MGAMGVMIRGVEHSIKEARKLEILERKVRTKCSYDDFLIKQKKNDMFKNSRKKKGKTRKSWEN